jgi:hypothetical protein
MTYNKKLQSTIEIRPFNADQTKNMRDLNPQGWWNNKFWIGNGKKVQFKVLFKMNLFLDLSTIFIFS